MEPEEFIGCILSIRTLPSMTDGASKAIIGTVRHIDTTLKTITLDEVIINGTIVDDAYVLSSNDIDDLSVCGKTQQPYMENPVVEKKQELGTVTTPAFSCTPKKPLQDSNMSFINNQLEGLPRPSNFYEVQGQDFGLGTSKPKPISPVAPSKKPNESPSQVSTKPSAFVKTETKVDNRTNQFYALNPACGGPMGMGDPPTKLSSTAVSKLHNPPKPSDGRVVYTASELEQKYFKAVDKSPTKTNASVMESIIARFSSSMKKETIPSPKQNSTTTTPNEKNQVQDQNVDPANSAAKKICNITADNPLYKLFVPHQVLLPPPTEGQAEELEKEKWYGAAAKNNPVGTGGRSQKKVQPYQKQNQFGRGPSQKQSVLTSTFEMTNDEIQSEEFDFEENLAMFEKLPVSSAAGKRKPITSDVKETKVSQFAKTDTTYLAERHVSSIQLKNEKPEKVFLTDTGVVVPSVTLPTRSKILNLAHNCGLTHGRMVEIMGRAVAQTAIPMLGDSYRLSPEREDDRPSVLVFAGPHWNGAVSVSAARILATQGIRTTVYVWNYELPLFTTELQLYRLTQQAVTTDLNELKGVNFDLIIAAMNDHRDAILNIKPFQHWMVGKPILLVDPPLLQSYRKAFLEPMSDNQSQNGASRLTMVVPTLPLAYPTETSVKIHLVNLGIPYEIFESNDVEYKSPFGDKLILQLFAPKQDMSSASS